jgi:phosphohistidine phosphatase
MIVGLFRHGIALPHGTPGVAEADRPLTPEGRKKTAQAAKGLKRLDLGFDAIYSSPLPRAMQTAEIVTEALKLGKPKVLDALLPDTPARQLLDEIRRLPAKTPLLVGHEPQLSSAVSLAIGKASVELKKAGLACVELKKSGATLKLLLSPGVLREIGSD